MKRFFKSGYNYIQDVLLKPGTYVFWAYIKSEFGNTFTFALANEANEWEVFDVDVEMGQWSKVYEVFTITEKKVKLDLINRYFDSEQPVFVFKPQLIKGNIPTDAGASPFDIDSIVDDLHDNIQGIADFTNDEFADRVLSAGERVSLKRDMEAVETIFQSLRGSYEKLIINPFVPEAVITDLTTKYNAVTSAKTNLFNVLNLIIAGDNIVTPEEITAKDDALQALNTALYNYNLAEKEIQNALGEDYTQKISAIRDFTDNEFADRVLSETEKISLAHDLDNVQTLVDSVTSRFNEMLENPFLTGADRDLLIEKYNALLDSWDWDEDLDPLKPNGLKTVILNIINDPDDLINPAEMLEKDAALSAFNIALGEFSETEVYISKVTIDYAIEQATFWSIHSTSPVIYKDAKDAVTDGYHMPVTVKGQLHRGTQIQDGGFITVTADDAAEAAEATQSPVLISPLDYDDKSSYTIRLYDSAAKTILLDTMTIPVVFRGANGKDAINITLSNEIDSVPASNEGVVSSYDNTGTDIRVFEGATELTYDGSGTSPGTFKVTSLGIDLTVGQISSPTVGILKCVIGNISNLAADKGITQFTIAGKTLEGDPFSEVKEQRITKGKMGAPGDPGDPGEDGDGITSTTIEYAKSSNGTAPPSTGWSTSLPSPTQGWYLWVRTTTTYKVAETTVTYSVSHWAEDGDGIVSTKIEYAKSSSGITPPPTGWSTNLPSPTLGWYLWVRTTTTYKISSTTVAYSVSRYAQDGDPGAPGEDGKGVSSVVIWYYKSSSATQLQGGSWSTTKPDYSASFFLWTKVITTYTDNSASETTPILDPEWHKVQAITDKFGVTTDGALIQAVMMLLREADSLDVTAGISGIQGTLKNNPSYWSGGTYSQAYALIQFLSKMSAGTNPESGEYENLAKIILLHNGAAKIGDFIIEPSGRIIIVDPTTGKEKIVFSATNIPTLADLLALTDFSGTQNASAFSNITPSTPITIATVYGVKAGSKITYSANSLMVTANSTYSANPSIGTTFRIDLMRNGSYYNSIRSIFIQAAGGSHSISTSINYLITGVPEGYYSVKFSIETSANTLSASADISSSVLHWEFRQAGVRWFQFGKNGMMAFFSDNHAHFTEEEGFDLKGKTNMPGVLLSASVSLSGGFANWWGAKKHATNTATRNSTGVYTVYHSVGHTEYQVSVTPSLHRTFYIASKTSTSFRVYMYSVGTSALSDSSFDFQIFGKNYA